MGRDKFSSWIQMPRNNWFSEGRGIGNSRTCFDLRPCSVVVGEEISQIIEQQDDPRVLISFSNVRHLSSAALGTLITINNKIKNKGGKLRLSDIDPQIYEVFVITRLNQLFQIHETADEAMASFG